MPQLPPVLWTVLGVTALLFLALVVLTARVVLRRRMRERIVAQPAWRVAAFVALAAVPWLVVELAPITVRANIDSLATLLLWLLGALAVFVLLVPFPLAAVLVLAIWLAARRRRGPV